MDSYLGLEVVNNFSFGGPAAVQRQASKAHQNIVRADTFMKRSDADADDNDFDTPSSKTLSDKVCGSVTEKVSPVKKLTTPTITRNFIISHKKT